MEVAIAILTMAFVALAIVVIINACELYRHKYKIEELIRDIQLLEGTQERFSEHLMKINDLKKEIDSIKDDFTDFERDHKIEKGLAIAVTEENNPYKAQKGE